MGTTMAWKWSATVVGHFLRVFECTRLESWSNEMCNVQLIPTLVASSTVHIYIANLEPQSKMEWSWRFWSPCTSWCSDLEWSRAWKYCNTVLQNCSQTTIYIISCWVGYYHKTTHALCTIYSLFTVFNWIVLEILEPLHWLMLWEWTRAWKHWSK